MARAAWQCSACQSSGVVHAELSHSPLVCDSTCSSGGQGRLVASASKLWGLRDGGGRKGMRRPNTASAALPRLPSSIHQMDKSHSAAPSQPATASSLHTDLRNRGLLARVGGSGAMHAWAPGPRQPKLHWIDVLAHRGAAAALWKARVLVKWPQVGGRGASAPVPDSSGSGSEGG